VVLQTKQRSQSSRPAHSHFALSGKAAAPSAREGRALCITRYVPLCARAATLRFAVCGVHTRVCMLCTGGPRESAACKGSSFHRLAPTCSILAVGINLPSSQINGQKISRGRVMTELMD
jgi:hypothetical protein